MGESQEIIWQKEEPFICVPATATVRVSTNQATTKLIYLKKIVSLLQEKIDELKLY
jgi:hypothetical protein